MLVIGSFRWNKGTGPRQGTLMFYYRLLNCGNQLNVYTQKALTNTPLNSYSTFPQKKYQLTSPYLYTVHFTTLKTSSLFRRCWFTNKPPYHYIKVMSWGGGTEHKFWREAGNWLRTELPQLHRTLSSDHLSCSNTEYLRQNMLRSVLFTSVHRHLFPKFVIGHYFIIKR